MVLKVRCTSSADMAFLAIDFKHSRDLLGECFIYLPEPLRDVLMHR